MDELRYDAQRARPDPRPVRFHALPRVVADVHAVPAASQRVFRRQTPGQIEQGGGLAEESRYSQGPQQSLAVGNYDR